MKPVWWKRTRKTGEIETIRVVRTEPMEWSLAAEGEPWTVQTGPDRRYLVQVISADGVSVITELGHGDMVYEGPFTMPRRVPKWLITQVRFWYGHDAEWRLREMR